MAALTTEERERAARRLARRLYGEKGQTSNCHLSQLVAVIGALDDVVEANLTAINNAIPEPQRSIMTAADKSEALAITVLTKTGVI